MAHVIRSAELPNKLRLPYVDQGVSSGVPLLLLHGYADSWRAFDLVLPRLPKSMRVIALTQRGHGDASRPREGYQSHDFALDLVEFMDALNIESAVIAGGSSGGFVARRFAMDHPNRIKGLVLLGSPFVLRDRPGVQELWASTISKLTDPIDPRFVREFQMSTITQPVPKAFLETMIRESLKIPARVWKKTFEGFMLDDSDEELAKIQVPSLMIWGDKDAIVPRSDQEALMAGIEGSKLFVYPGVGHAIYWEQPAQVASDLVAFVENIGN